jgi:cell division protein FtsW (lipid II flippase)
MNVASRDRTGKLIAFGFPIASLILAVIPKWSPFADIPNLGLLWLWFTIFVGLIGIAILPWRWWARLLACLIYVPAACMTLATGNVVLGCVVHGSRACP